MYPVSDRTRERCLDALRTSGMMYYYVPEELKGDLEICTTAVTTCPAALALIDDKHCTPELIRAAFGGAAARYHAK